MRDAKSSGSRKDEPNWSMCSIALTFPARLHFQRTRKDGTRVWTNVAAYQEKEKNEKTVKRKAGEDRRQADFKEAACYPSAVGQGAALRKNSFVRGVP